MDNLKVFAILIIVTIIALLSVFQMQIKGYEKVGRIEQWVLYIDKTDECVLDKELIYSDEINDYYLSCKASSSYIFKSGFEEIDLIKALEDDLITIEDLDILIDISIVKK